ncbi:uncharacterized protein A4U43_C08F14910 [Asparagus officinalis]|nr:uncharacterized protein A4U43_C08F14910 [Asparagus officinalis]
MNITTEQGKTLKDAQGDVFRGYRPERVAHAVAVAKVGDPAKEVVGLISGPEPSCRVGKELARTLRGAEKQAAPPPEPMVGEADGEQESFDWSFCH